ncbi:helix-turn-helix domain-containing protein [Martelella alba]|uniref:Helix-turn-helix domain-containing protein n=1 Tax=Martelella alba TaxID=2590451 RepID=A0ABY2SIC1_9HYPH|nr:helix-turn-helix domain-containing protein [Martelella alba]TKI04468.1 helix-turn-helix domain-containing protein [Martelella alba]
MLRISQVIEIARVSRKTVYNAINSGRLKYQLVTLDNRQVRMFDENDVLDAFPKANRTSLEVQALQQEIAALKFALAELQKAVDAMDPASQVAMISAEPKK